VNVVPESRVLYSGLWFVVCGWWLVVGGWWLVVGGWWLVVYRGFSVLLKYRLT
jgi:hypothetical protein